jgi:hypothetical protein
MVVQLCVLDILNRGWFVPVRVNLLSVNYFRTVRLSRNRYFLELQDFFMPGLRRQNLHRSDIIRFYGIESQPLVSYHFTTIIDELSHVT